MKTLGRIFVWLFLIIGLFSCVQVTDTDVFVVGGGCSGTAAGIESARMGVNTCILEEGEWLGGMLTSAGVSAVDGNFSLRGGIYSEFYDSLVSYYGSSKALQTGWVSNVLYEPSVGAAIFRKIASSEDNLDLYFKSKLTDIKRKNDAWIITAKVNDKTHRFNAKIIIDATELGDVAAFLDVPYDLGMDAREESGEEIAPEYSNSIVQDLTYVMVLKDYGRDVTISRPINYDSTLFACACENSLCNGNSSKGKLWPAKSMLNYGRLPNSKYMINWPIEGNDFYVNIIEMDEDQRNIELEAAKERSKGFLYFIQKELGYNTLGIADDEFPSKDGFPLIPYHRESRRIHGKVSFHIGHIEAPYDQEKPLYRTAIGVGDYPIDHHHNRYSGTDTLPDLHFYPVPSYGFPLGALVPNDCEGLIVAEKSVSVTNLVNGSTRLQPVVLQIGQAAGNLAAMACLNNQSISDVPVRKVQNNLLNHGAYLLPYLDVEKAHPWFLPLQRIGATGILKAEGRNIGWENQTWIRAYDTAKVKDVIGLLDLYSIDLQLCQEDDLTRSSLMKLIIEIAVSEGITLDQDRIQAISTHDDQKISRGQLAVLIDTFLDPFNSKQIDLNGYYMHNSD